MESKKASQRIQLRKQIEKDAFKLTNKEEIKVVSEMSRAREKEQVCV